MHTKTEVVLDRHGNLTEVSTGDYVVVSGVAMPSGNHPKKDEAKANTALLAEAINVFVETGMTPERLLEEISGLRVDAERWRKARKILSVDDISDRYDDFVSFGRTSDEAENVRADLAVDAIFID